jgi:kinesin family protein 11
MDVVLEEIKTLREDIKARVGQGLQGLSVAAERISAEVMSELGAFHTQVCRVLLLRI